MSRQASLVPESRPVVDGGALAGGRRVLVGPGRQSRRAPRFALMLEIPFGASAHRTRLGGSGDLGASHPSSTWGRLGSLARQLAASRVARCGRGSPAADVGPRHRTRCAGSAKAAGTAGREGRSSARRDRTRLAWHGGSVAPRAEAGRAAALIPRREREQVGTIRVRRLSRRDTCAVLEEDPTGPDPDLHPRRAARNLDLERGR